MSVAENKESKSGETEYRQGLSQLEIVELKAGKGESFGREK